MVMVPRFGSVRQLGVVVKDAEAAMLHWGRHMGVGPFFVIEGATFQDYRYRGVPGPSPVCTFGYAQAGDLQVEIIAQTNDAPSGYLDFLASGREGCQHLSSWQASDAEFEAVYAQALSSGAQLMHEGYADGSRFAYFATGEGLPGGLAFEIAVGLRPELLPVHAMLRAANESWDGSDPIRRMPS
ncbi:VOC family protein [Sphingobium sp. MI1205]|uniref:VOC family protein n=1 Tax=Sphingobium sp. MI1205 TaxID=407020 RepID=UPI00077005A7|nr:VOC family protein [Sphingobium sp. MI1205]AMK18483.1 hypothetical protein K663_10525 [Sphingobium sp. MI1205]